MTTMKLALENAGVKVPLNKRVWMWLKDHGPATSKAVADALKSPRGDVSSILGKMCSRKMCSYTEEKSKLSPHGVNYYSVAIKEFELLPMPKVNTPEPIRVAPTPLQFVPAPIAAKAPPAKPTLDNMNVREAHALYVELHRMFGGTNAQP